MLDDQRSRVYDEALAAEIEAYTAYKGAEAAYDNACNVSDAAHNRLEGVNRTQCGIDRLVEQGKRRRLRHE